MIPQVEDPAQLETILDELQDEWRPASHTEAYLVEQIAVAEWRLRRVQRAEIGEIRERIPITPSLNILEQISGMPDSLLPKMLGQTAEGVTYLLHAVRDALDELERNDSTSIETCDRLERFFGDERINPARLLKLLFREKMPEPVRKSLKNLTLPQGIDPDPKLAARQHLNGCSAILEDRRQRLKRKENLEREIELQRCAIPGAEAYALLQRYETATRKELNRAIDRLSDLQTRRRYGA